MEQPPESEAAEMRGRIGASPVEKVIEPEEDSDDRRRYRAWMAEKFSSLRAGDSWPGERENFLYGPTTLLFSRTCAKVRVVIGEEGSELPPGEGPPFSEIPGQAGQLAALFQPYERTDRRPNTVVLQGPMGIGKTVLARKLMLDWAHGHLCRDVFQYVFYFNLGDMDGTAEKSMAELISGEWPSPPVPVSDILSQPQNLLFVLDGLEELKPFLDGPEAELCRDWNEPRPLASLLQGLLRRTLLPEACLLLVVRPSGWARLARWLGCPQLVEVLGLSKADREEYFHRFFGDRASARAALATVRDNETLATLCRSPLVCWLICTGLKQRLDDGQDLSQGPLTATRLYVSYVTGLFRGRAAPQEGQLRALCRLAADGVLAHATGFDTSDLQRHMLTPADLEPFLNTHIILGRAGGYAFLHLTLQEFFAALYSAMEVTRSPSAAHSVQDLTTELEKYSGVDTSFLSLAVHFLFGLLNPECARLLDAELGCRLSPQLRRDLLLWAAVFSGSAAPSLRALSLHHFFFSLYETQDAAFVEEAMDHFRDLQLVLWSKVDLLVSSFCLCHCRRLEKLVLHLQREVFHEQDPDDPESPTEAEAGPQALDLIASRWKALYTVLSTNATLREMELSFSSMNDLCMKCLSDQLSHPDCHLHTLRIRQTAFVPFACGDFPLALIGHQHLICLDLDLQLGDDGMKLLCEALRHPQCNLQYLRLKSCALTKACCPDLALALTCNQSLSHLNLEGNQLLDSGVQVLCEALNRPECHLQKLVLAGCGLTDSGCQDLSATLTASRKLTHLCLAHNSLRDEGLKILSTALKCPDCPLQKLTLWSCGLTAAGCQDLATVLLNNKNLTHLDLGENDLGDDGMKLLCAALAQPQCSLQALDVLVCFLTEACCQDLADALILNRNLHSLNLGHNALKDEGVKLLCKALRHPDCQLQRLGLERCQINTAGCQDLSSVILCNSRLKSLNLAQNALWDEGVRLLCEALERPECGLQLLALWKEAFSEDAQRMLKAAEENRPQLVITGDWYSHEPEEFGFSWWLET
ncbi:NACHT, LRR and PYD domains-containing protein 14 [Sarcophilus harrisii]|uniref:NACHT domain-containing protein n=1 Tax=Sarcophilus harrisii TaxID=9305 RepID=A0A7N4V1M0_SARHA|nr:NACHT, LRR and PYD domains-containing protein 14 [Sarcophilus harrisii]XP_031819391.1 NACHT, LRR and PYD domains-containing protein 14 [Sarcophilus harrisii]